MRILKDTRGVPRDTIAYLAAHVSGLEKELTSLTTDDASSRFNLSNFNKGKEIVDQLNQAYQQTNKQVSYDKVRLEQIRTAYESDITTIHLVEKAQDPIVKSRPKRSYLVLGSIFVAFVLGCLYFIFMASAKENNWTFSI